MFHTDQFGELDEWYPREADLILAMQEYDVRCFGRVYPRKDNGALYRARLFIDVDQEDRSVARCVKEEIFNATGLLNDPVGHGSLFDDQYRRPQSEPMVYDNYSEIEGVMLKTLYSNRLVAGMQRHETERALEEMIETDCPLESEGQERRPTKK